MGGGYRLLLMSELVHRVVQRYLQAGDVIPFGKPRKGPKVPQVTIAGSKYNLSDYSGFGGGLGDDELGDGGGARVIRLPSGNKWRYLWVYNTDRQDLTMWRASDGDEKFYNSARSETSLIVRLEKKGQLNRVSNQEYRKIEKAMQRQYEETLRHLEETVENLKDDFQREVDHHVWDYYNRSFKPKIEKAVAEVRAGATPFGFKPFGPPGEDKTRQKITYVASRALEDFTAEKVEAYLRRKGVDVDNPNHDPQATYWAVTEVKDKAIQALHR